MATFGLTEFAWRRVVILIVCRVFAWIHSFDLERMNKNCHLLNMLLTWRFDFVQNCFVHSRKSDPGEKGYTFFSSETFIAAVKRSRIWPSSCGPWSHFEACVWIAKVKSLAGWLSERINLLNLVLAEPTEFAGMNWFKTTSLSFADASFTGEARNVRFYTKAKGLFQWNVNRKLSSFRHSDRFGDAWYFKSFEEIHTFFDRASNSVECIVQFPSWMAGGSDFNGACGKIFTSQMY